MLRELPISLGRFGDVALFEVGNSEWVTELAVRHQREDDYFRRAMADLLRPLAERVK